MSRCPIVSDKPRVSLVCPSTCECTEETRAAKREIELAVERYIERQRAAKPEGEPGGR